LFMVDKKDAAGKKHFIFTLTLAEALLVTLFGVMTAITSAVVRLPLHIPGHTGLLFMFMLTLSCIIVRKFGAGTLAGFIAGFVVVLVAPGTKGFFAVFDFMLPGLFLDAFIFLFPGMADRWYSMGLLAGTAHLTKLLSTYIVGTLLHLPLGFLFIGLGMALLFHFLFGFGGGVIACLARERVGFLQKISKQ